MALGVQLVAQHVGAAADFSSPAPAQHAPHRGDVGNYPQIVRHQQHRHAVFRLQGLHIRLRDLRLALLRSAGGGDRPSPWRSSPAAATRRTVGTGRNERAVRVGKPTPVATLQHSSRAARRAMDLQHLRLGCRWAVQWRQRAQFGSGRSWQCRAPWCSPRLPTRKLGAWSALPAPATGVPHTRPRAEAMFRMLREVSVLPHWTIFADQGDVCPASTDTAHHRPGGGGAAKADRGSHCQHVNPTRFWKPRVGGGGLGRRLAGLSCCDLSDHPTAGAEEGGDRLCRYCTPQVGVGAHGVEKRPGAGEQFMSPKVRAA